MDVLIILQFVTIAITLFSLVFGYIVAAKEKTKDNKTEIFSKKLSENIVFLRENMNIILAISNPSTLREQIHYKELQNPNQGSSPWLDYMVLEKFEEALSNIKSIFFPFYPQENHLISAIESLKQTSMEYFECTNKKKQEEILVTLKAKIREVYMQYALYDRAMTEAIAETTTNSNYGFYSFDEYYSKISEEQNIRVLQNKAKSFTRENQLKTIDEKEVANLVNNQPRIKGKKSGISGE